MASMEGGKAEKNFCFLTCGLFSLSYSQASDNGLWIIRFFSSFFPVGLTVNTNREVNETGLSLLLKVF